MKTSLKLLLLLPLLLCTASCDQIASHSESGSGGKFAARGPYRAFVWLRVAKQRPKIMFDVEQESHYLNDREAQPILIRSGLVLDTALQQPGIAQLDCLKGVTDKVTWLGNRLEVGYLGNSEILQIAISGNDRDELMKILLAVRLAYMDRIVAVDRELDMRRRMTLEQAYKNTEKVITRKRIQLRTLEDQLAHPNSQSSNSRPPLPPESLRELKAQIDQRKLQITDLDSKITVLSRRLKDMADGKTISFDERQRIMEKDSVISNLKQEIAVKEADIAALEQVENSEVEPLRQQLEEQKQQLAARQEELAPLMEEMLRYIQEQTSVPAPEDAAIHEEIAQATLEREILQTTQESLVKVYFQESAKVDKFSYDPTELNTLRRELSRLEQMYDRMGAQLEEWAIEAQASQRVQTINEPTAIKVR